MSLTGYSGKFSRIGPGPSQNQFLKFGTDIGIGWTCPHFLELVLEPVEANSNVGCPILWKCDVISILNGGDFLKLVMKSVGTDFSIGYPVPNGVKRLNCFIVKLNKD